MVNFIWENIFRKAEKEKNISALLGENMLFQDLSRRELKFVENIVHIRHYRTGENIFRQNEVGVGMYIIVKGSVDILVDQATDEKTAKDLFITRLIAGDFFGELSLVEESGLRSATARAHDETTLIGFFQPDLREILERRPSTGVKVTFRLAEVLGRRLKETTEKVTQLRNEVRTLRQHHKSDVSLSKQVDNT